MIETPIISVIVPVYKTEKYLPKCLDSIIHQTYKNLEIILVDDGSPDNCGAICDRYAEQDSRILVVHQQNKGVSAARNTGLKMKTGEYIGWVDSDDWIELDMYEYLLKNALQYQADIAVCGRSERYIGRTITKRWKQDEVLGKESALRSLLENRQMQNFLWDKLWHRDLFEGIWFPEGMTYEDIAVMHRLFEMAEKVICLREVKYNYVQHAGSIIANVSLENKINHYIAAKTRYEDMQEKWPQFKPLLLAQCTASAIGVWCCYNRNPTEIKKAMLSDMREISRFCGTYDRIAYKYLGLGLAGKTVLKLIRYPENWSFTLAQIISWIYKQKHGKAL